MTFIKILNVITRLLPSTTNENKCACTTENIALDDTTIRDAVYEYFDRETKQDVISKYGEIDCWNVSKVTDMSTLFELSNYFNENLKCWDTSSVTDMSYMFADCKRSSPKISNWDTSNVRSMKRMFWYNVRIVHFSLFIRHHASNDKNRVILMATSAIGMFPASPPWNGCLQMQVRIHKRYIFNTLTNSN